MNITLGSILVIVIAGILIRSATKFIMKLLGWILLILALIYVAYHFGIGPFKQNPISIETWEAKYCENPEEQVKCNCIVYPIKNDLESRFTPEELDEIAQDRAEMAYVIKKSFEEVKDQIGICLAKEDAEEELSEFMKDMIPVDNDALDKLSDLKDEIQESVENEVDDLRKRKDRLDSQYD